MTSCERNWSPRSGAPPPKVYYCEKMPWFESSSHLKITKCQRKLLLAQNIDVIIIFFLNNYHWFALSLNPSLSQIRENVWISCGINNRNKRWCTISQFQLSSVLPASLTVGKYRFFPHLSRHFHLEISSKCMLHRDYNILSIHHPLNKNNIFIKSNG